MFEVFTKTSSHENSLEMGTEQGKKYLGFIIFYLFTATAFLFVGTLLLAIPEIEYWWNIFGGIIYFYGPLVFGLTLITFFIFIFSTLFFIFKNRRETRKGIIFGFLFSFLIPIFLMIYFYLNVHY